jgi:transposase-like protein
MESEQVLREAIKGTTVKEVAHQLGVSAPLVYKWCEPKGENASGTDNPLDRLLRFCEVTGSEKPIQWLCEQVNAFYVENIPPGDPTKEELRVLDMTQRILREFTDMLNTVSQSIANDGRVDREETVQIRQEWEELKRVGERFVLGCEMGVYHNT